MLAKSAVAALLAAITLALIAYSVYLHQELEKREELTQKALAQQGNLSKQVGALEAEIQALRRELEERRPLRATAFTINRLRRGSSLSESRAVESP
jgi:Tfp pilus assembly protein PilO